MNATKEGLYDRLIALGVASFISTYRTQPAVFTRNPVPEDAEFIYIVIRDSVADDPGLGETKTTTGRVVLHDIGVFGDEDGDPEAVEDLAALIRDGIHRNPVTVSGYGNLIASASGPIVAPSEDQVYGRIVQVRLELIRAN